MTNLTIGVKFSIYYFSNHQYLLHIRGITIKIFMPILKVFFKMVVNWVKTQCKFFAKGLTNELVMWFFNSYMMNVLGVKSILNIGYNLKLIIFFPCIYLLGLYNITHYWWWFSFLLCSHIIINNSSLFMSMLNLISININIMDMKMHMLICLFISMLVGKERGEIVIKIRDSY